MWTKMGRTRSSTEPAASTITAKGSTRRAWDTATPCTCPTSTRTAPAWRSSTSTSDLGIPMEPSSATLGPASSSGERRSPDVGRGVAMDIDPRHRGYEMWASGQGLAGLWNVKGETISERKPRSCNFGVWWDGDLLREILDSNRITKWNWESGTETTLLVRRRLHLEQFNEIDPVPLCGYPRRLAGGGYLEDRATTRNCASTRPRSPPIIGSTH